MIIMEIILLTKNFRIFVENIEETGNRAYTDRIDKNPEINESNTMSQPGVFKGFKDLCRCF